MLFLYNVSLYLYRAGIKLSALTGNVKARQWLEGRKNWRTRLRGRSTKKGQCFWFHCSSLGEFEQGRPLLESMRKKFPDAEIVLSFFSPSGYEIRKNYPLADLVCYLPMDSKKNALDFISALKPDAVFFIKYDYWFHYLRQLRKNQIPVFIISGIFRPAQHFFKWYGGFFRKMLRQITHFFVQDETSLNLLQSLSIKHCSLSGDTRFDRVYQQSMHPEILPKIEVFKGNLPLLVAGSTWSSDESILLGYLQRKEKPQLKILIAPHNLDHIHIEKLRNKLVRILSQREVALYTETNEEHAQEIKVLILDTMGQLNSAYRYGNIAYVGGGFERGIHNTLEPAAYGIPVIFGPKYDKFREAKELIECGAAFSVRTPEEFALLCDSFLKQKSFLQNSGFAAGEYIKRQTGSTGIIMHKVLEMLRTKNYPVES